MIEMQETLASSKSDNLMSLTGDVQEMEEHRHGADLSVIIFS